MWRLCSGYADDAAIFTNLALSFGDEVDARGPEQEVARPPDLFAVFFQEEDALEVGDDDGRTLEVLLV